MCGDHSAKSRERRFRGARLDLTNADRKANALGVLTVNPTLVVAALKKATDMAAKSYFAHTSPEGLTPWHWFFQKTGYCFGGRRRKFGGEFFRFRGGGAGVDEFSRTSR